MKTKLQIVGVLVVLYVATVMVQNALSCGDDFEHMHCPRDKCNVFRSAPLTFLFIPTTCSFTNHPHRCSE